MKQVVGALIAVLSLGSLANGQQQPAASYEQLKSFDQLAGTWIYEGPALEDIPGLVAKGDRVTVRTSWQWILDKHALETQWVIEIPEKFSLVGRGLIAWDGAGSRIVGGGVDSTGGHSLDVTTYDAATKTWTTESRGADGSGKQTTATVVQKLIDADTMTWQITEQSGGEPSGVYTLKRGEAGQEEAAPAQSVRKAAPRAALKRVLPVEAKAVPEESARPAAEEKAKSVEAETDAEDQGDGGKRG